MRNCAVLTIVCIQVLVFGEDNMKYLVSIRPYSCDENSSKDHFCNGIIISPTAILTAAHCVMDKRKIRIPPWRLEIVAGATMTFRVRDSTIHPKFIASTTHNLALLYIIGRFPQENDQIKIISIADETVKNGEKCEVIGWGQFTEKDSAASSGLSYKLSVESSSKCLKAQPFHLEQMICAVDFDNDDRILQNYDSGAALLCRGALTAVLSWKVDCGYGVVPRVFTDVVTNREWVKQSILTDRSTRTSLFSTFYMLTLALLAIVIL